MECSMFYDLDNNNIPESQILGYGSTGVVIRQGDRAVKIPLKLHDGSEDDLYEARRGLERELEIFTRIGHHVGIVGFLGTSGDALYLELMENGDLQTYLEKNSGNDRPPRSLQLSWARQIARTLAYIHSRRVLVLDIASRNFLLDANLSIKFADFNQTRALDLNTDMESWKDCYYSIQTEIGMLGAVIYEIVTGKRCKFNNFDSHRSKGNIPPRSTLPSTENVWLGPIIEKCWTEGGFRNAECLADALDSVSFEDEYPTTDIKRDIKTHHIPALSLVFELTVTFGAFYILTSVWKRT